MSRGKRFIEYLEDYFNLRRFERYGLALILVFGLLFLVVRVSIPTTDHTDDLQAFIDVIQTEDVDESGSFIEIEDVSSFRLRPFDPNTISKPDLFEMGLPPSAVKSIINFRSSGFQYRKPEDLLKCYGVDQLLFEEIAPFVVILDNSYSKDVESGYKPKLKKDTEIMPFRFDPNEVTRSELESMNLPDRFIDGFLNFRNAGAKFYGMEDLGKVYSLTDEIKEAILPYLLFPDKPNFDKWKNTPNTHVAQRFRFDPNQISKDSLLLLGVSQSAANIWINYRNGGKVFYTIEDLRSIFGLPESKIQELEDWIDFPTLKTNDPQVWARTPQVSLNIDPNVATLEDLMEIKGIGRSYGSRILWRKKQLGGYYSINQIGESENLPDSTFQAVKYHFVQPTLDSLIKINVNTTRRRAFADHPYITYDRVNRIITHREFVGPKLTLEYLLKVELLSKEEARLLEPYLVFE